MSKGKEYLSLDAAAILLASLNKTLGKIDPSSQNELSNALKDLDSEDTEVLIAKLQLEDIDDSGTDTLLDHKDS